MISNQLLPSFYLLEVEGEAVKSIIPGENGIKKIAITSRDFSCDVTAFAGMEDALKSIVDPLPSDASLLDKTEFNPEFYPMLPLTDDQKQKMDVLKDIIENAQEDLPEGQVAIPITKVFDATGDFVAARHTMQSRKYRVVGKVAVSPQTYISEKLQEVAAQHAHFSTYEMKQNTRIH